METWSRGTSSRLPFGVNVNLNLSINSNLQIASSRLTESFLFFSGVLLKISDRCVPTKVG